MRVHLELLFQNRTKKRIKKIEEDLKGALDFKNEIITKINQKQEELYKSKKQQQEELQKSKNTKLSYVT